MNPRVSHQKTAALTLTEVVIVICVIAVLAIVTILPALYSASTWHGKKGLILCVGNLKKIGTAYYVWAGDHNGNFPMQVSVANGGTMELNADGKNAWLNFQVMSNELNKPNILICPADKNKVWATNFTTDFNNSKISYFIGLDADTNHLGMLLSGDDNFAIGGVPVKSGLLELSTNTSVAWTAKRHVNVGNIGLSDGSIASVRNSSLTNQLRFTGLATNRLAIP